MVMFARQSTDLICAFPILNSRTQVLIAGVIRKYLLKYSLVGTVCTWVVVRPLSLASYNSQQFSP